MPPLDAPPTVAFIAFLFVSTGLCVRWLCRHSDRVEDTLWRSALLLVVVFALVLILVERFTMSLSDALASGKGKALDPPSHGPRPAGEPYGRLLGVAKDGGLREERLFPELLLVESADENGGNLTLG